MSNRTTVGLVQINNSFSGQSYFPYSVGILQAYAQRHLSSPDRYEFLAPVFKRIPVKEAVAQLAPSDVVGFSLYVWNARLSLAIARELKRQKPETLIVMGGPHVPNNAAQFLAVNPFVDVACHSEGEKPFCAILEDLGDWKRTPSISYLEEGKFFKNPNVERMKNLDEVPSPYLEGIFDGLMAANPAEQWIAVWETNRGCPFGCTYCDWGSNVNAKIGRWGMGRLFAEVDWFAAQKTLYVFCADANFGILPQDLQIAEYCAATKQKTGFPSKLSVQAAKNTTRGAMEKTWKVQKTLSDGGLNQGVVISMQSLNPATLKAVKRDNMKLEYFEEIQRRYTEGGVETMSDFILGMPCETYDSLADGVAKLIAGGQHNRIQFNNLSILPNAEMGDPLYQVTHGMEMVESNIVNVHGAKSEDDEVPEMQQLVIATKSLPRPEWVRTRVYAWMVSLLHFNKVLQMPLILTKECSGASYREIIELFSEGKFQQEAFPQLFELKEFFTEKALDIQRGGEEYCHAPQWLDIWWPADEYALIHMAVDGKLNTFYYEAFERLAGFLYTRNPRAPLEALEQAVGLNSDLMKAPFQTEDLRVELSWNVWEFYQAILRGKHIPLRADGPYRYRIDRTSERWDTWDDWYRKVVWWGNKRGAYLYGNAPVEQLAGHF